MSNKRSTEKTELEIIQVPVGRLKGAAYNPRLMSDAEMARLCKSIEAFGFVEPVVARRADNTIIGAIGASRRPSSLE